MKVRSSHLAIVSLLAAALLGSALPASAAPQSAATAPPPQAADWAGLFRPDPRMAAIGALPEPLPAGKLVEAALLASGVESARLDSYIDRLRVAFASLREEAAGIVDPAARGEAALAFLHRRLLVAYREDATTLDGILDTGEYNCVSSAVLYLVAARTLRLEVRGVRTPDHAFCVLSLPGREIDVETTNPHGFDPGTKKNFTDSFGKVTGFAYTPPGAYAKRESIGEKTLVSLILSNRASILERRGHFLEALRLGVDLAAASPGAESRAFLAGRVNNLAAELFRRGDFAGALALAGAARASVGPDPLLDEIADTAAYNGAAGLAQAGRWEEALAAAEALLATSSARGRKPPAELASLLGAALGTVADHMASSGDFAAARSAVEARRGVLIAIPGGKAAWEGAMERLYVNQANRVGSSGDWLAGATLAEEGARAAPGDGNIARAAAALRRNFVAEAHNRFAALFNARDYRGARAAVEAALLRLPADGTLLADLAAVRKAMGQ